MNKLTNIYNTSVQIFKKQTGGGKELMNVLNKIKQDLNVPKSFVDFYKSPRIDDKTEVLHVVIMDNSRFKTSIDIYGINKIGMEINYSHYSKSMKRKLHKDGVNLTPHTEIMDYDTFIKQITPKYELYAKEYQRKIDDFAEKDEMLVDSWDF